LHWDVMILLGGGFALSAGIVKTGLDVWLGSHMEVLKSVPYFLLIPVVALFVNITTEFAANVATATLFLPIVAEVAISIGQHPLLLMIPATFSCNYSFILPIATPPNAVAHSTGYTKPVDMILPGFIMKVVGVLFLAVLTPTLGAWVFGLNDPTDFTK
jgi:sodium-dependent dicarboxylate transporter 2/3/5